MLIITAKSVATLIFLDHRDTVTMVALQVVTIVKMPSAKVSNEKNIM